MTAEIGTRGVDWRWLKARIPGALSVAECAVLAECARATDADHALEVGHYLGLSTAVLLLSLPAECALTTIDHHEGDDHSGASPVDDFARYVTPYVGHRPFASMHEDMTTALPVVVGPIGFVFYDADHSRAGVETFWTHAMPLLAERCTLVFDDADWPDQATLFGLAEAEGFRSLSDRPHARRERDKKHPDTYTLAVMGR